MMPCFNSTGVASLQVPEQLGFRPIHEFQESASVQPRGERPAAIRESARMLRARLQGTGAVRAVRTVDLLTIPYPAQLALGGAGRIARPWISLVGRLVIVRFEAFSGQLKTLAWEPARAESLMVTPFHARVSGRYGVGPARPFAARQLYSVPSALMRCGVGPHDVDFVAFGDLRGQDLRSIAGTTRPPISAHQSRLPLFPDARVLVQRLELETVRAPHPVQEQWYVPGSLADVDEGRIVALDGDVELGAGVAIIATPGRTVGHQSLLLRTSDGIWMLSGNGVASDCWQPLLSKIPGVRRAAEADGREVVLDAGAEDMLDLHDSMVKEKSLADLSRVDPRWQTILPSRELMESRWQWPLVPTFSHGSVRADSPAHSAG
jgi:hypothetical protein